MITAVDIGQSISYHLLKLNLENIKCESTMMDFSFDDLMRVSSLTFVCHIDKRIDKSD